MTGKLKGAKRKASEIIDEKKKPPNKAEEVSEESENEVCMKWCHERNKVRMSSLCNLQNNLLNGVNNEENDTTDDEGVDELFTSDDDDELSFVSDEEGNYEHVGNISDESGEGSGFEVDSLEEGEEEESDGEDADSESEGAEEESDGNDNEESQREEKVVQNLKNIKISKQNKKKEAAGPSEAPAVDKVVARPDKSAASTSSGFQEYGEDDPDTSDEEDIRNTVGNIPMHWYDEYKHIGYDWEAKKIIKPAQGDQIDDFLKKIEDPNFWRTVKDPQTGQQVVLSEADIDVIKRINTGRVPDGSYNQYEVSFSGLIY